jgi:hypothetical protein
MTNSDLVMWGSSSRSSIQLSNNLAFHRKSGFRDMAIPNDMCCIVLDVPVVIGVSQPLTLGCIGDQTAGRHMSPALDCRRRQLDERLHFHFTSKSSNIEHVWMAASALLIKKSLFLINNKTKYVTSSLVNFWSWKTQSDIPITDDQTYVRVW